MPRLPVEENFGINTNPVIANPHLDRSRVIEDLRFNFRAIGMLECVSEGLPSYSINLIADNRIKLIFRPSYFHRKRYIPRLRELISIPR